MAGTIDYFTKTEFDPIVETIQEKLNSIDIAWRLNSVQYEKDTGYIHYEWAWEMV
jgi:nucleosome binding factor SPN SPT16 subunit